MKRQRLALTVVVVAVVVPLVGLLLVEAQLRERVSRRPEVGAVFPSLSESSEKKHPASPGRRRVVVFAKAGCGNCDRTISALSRLVPQEGYELTAVVAGSTVESAGGEGGMLRFIPDLDGSLSRRFGVVQVPLVFVLDGESRVEAVLTGERPQSAWLSVLAGDDAI